jgi:hypothetical protein
MQRAALRRHTQHVRQRAGHAPAASAALPAEARLSAVGVQRQLVERGIAHHARRLNCVYSSKCRSSVGSTMLRRDRRAGGRKSVFAVPAGK